MRRRGFVDLALGLAEIGVLVVVLVGLAARIEVNEWRTARGHFSAASPSSKDNRRKR